MSCHSLTPLEVQDAEGESGRAARRVFSEEGMCWVGVDGRGRGRGVEGRGEEAASTCSMCLYVHNLFKQLAYT